MGWQLTMAFGVVAAAGLFSVTFFNTRERIAPPPNQQSDVRQDVKDLAHNGPWLALFFLALIIMMTENSHCAKAELCGYCFPW